MLLYDGESVCSTHFLFLDCAYFSVDRPSRSLNSVSIGLSNILTMLPFNNRLTKDVI